MVESSKHFSVCSFLLITLPFGFSSLLAYMFCFLLSLKYLTGFLRFSVINGGGRGRGEVFCAPDLFSTK